MVILQEIARKRALGIPIDPDEDTYVDPFEKMKDVVSDDEDTSKKPDQVTWSYSQYMKALDREEVLNEVDENTFSSLMKQQQGEYIHTTTWFHFFFLFFPCMHLPYHFLFFFVFFSSSFFLFSFSFFCVRIYQTTAWFQCQMKQQLPVTLDWISGFQNVGLYFIGNILMWHE